MGRRNVMAFYMQRYLHLQVLQTQRVSVALFCIDIFIKIVRSDLVKLLVFC